MEDSVSIIIASYNRFDKLQDCINSILKQTYKNFEIIVVNDASTDEAYYKNWIQDTHIRQVNLEINSKMLFGYASGGYVRNIGIRHAKYPLIAICDDDDMWHESKLELQLYYMKKHNIYFSSSDAYLCTEGFRTNPSKDNIKPYQLYYIQHHKSILGTNSHLPELFPCNFLQLHNFVIHSTLMFSKDLYDKVGGYKSVRNGEEDWNLLKDMNSISEHVYINVPLAYYEYK